MSMEGFRDQGQTGNALERVTEASAIDHQDPGAARLIVPGLTVVTTESGWAAAALHPWEVAPSTSVKGFRRIFGHYLTVASVVRDNDGAPGPLLLEAHNDQRDNKNRGAVPCSEIQCPYMGMYLGQVGTSRVIGAQIENDPEGFWHRFWTSFSSRHEAAVRLRTAGPEHDVFDPQNDTLRTLAVGIVAGHNLISPAAREAFETLRTAQGELPGRSEHPPIEGTEPRGITG